MGEARWIAHRVESPDRKRGKARPTGPKDTGYVRGLYRLDHVAEEVAESFEKLVFQQVDNLAFQALAFEAWRGRV